MKKLILTLSLLTLTYACKKDNVDEENIDYKIIEDNHIAEFFLEDVLEIVEEAYDTAVITRAASNRTDTIKISNVNSILTIDFGAKGIQCIDGKTRKGKIIVKYPALFVLKNVPRYYEFEDYYVGGDHLANTSYATITYNGTDSFFNPNWTIDARLTVEKGVTGKTINWNCNRNRYWIKGDSLARIWTDDVYMNQGTASGKSAEGYDFNTVIDGLILTSSWCSKIQQGSMKLNRDKRVNSINYGSDSVVRNCDNHAVITYHSGRMQDIDL